MFPDRFLSTSLGYRYLEDLDYITQEMDDWFLVSTISWLLGHGSQGGEGADSVSRAETTRT